MSTDRVKDPFERHLGCTVSAPAKHRSPFLQFLQLLNPTVSIVQRANQPIQVLQALIVVNFEFWGAKGTWVPVPLVQQSAQTERGHHCPCRRALCYSKYKADPASGPTALLTHWTPNSQAESYLESYLISFLGKFPSQKLFTLSRLPTMLLSLHCYLFPKPQTCMYLKDIFANRLHSALSDWK